MSRLDQYSVTVAVDGRDIGTFDKMGGGEIDSEEVKYKPGAMAPQVSLGGSRSVSNVTVQRLFRLERELGQLSGTALSVTDYLDSRVGKGACVVTKTSLDVDTNPFGKPKVYRGTLKKVKYPDPDSESNSAAMLELEVSSTTVA